MKFSKFALTDIADSDHDPSEYRLVVRPHIVDQDRWTTCYEMVFQHLLSGKFYKTGFRRGSTEYQEERPYEYDDDFIECVEVEPKEVTVTVYHPVDAERVVSFQ